VVEAGGQWTVGRANGDTLAPIVQIARDALSWMSQSARKDEQAEDDKEVIKPS
jgi:hypothetical protein